LLSETDLREIAAQLSRRPGHEKVRILVHDLLVRGPGVPSENISEEETLPTVRGFMDALTERTVFEYKSDLRRELPDAKRQLQRYLEDVEADSQDRYVAIATDGATFDTNA
jgi:hypothetical protein